MGRKKADLWTLEDLARRVWEERSQIIRIGQDDHPPYYMTTLRHPTIRVLYDQVDEDIHKEFVYPFECDPVGESLTKPENVLRLINYARYY